MSLTALHQTLQKSTKINKLASDNVQSALDNELESDGFIVDNINSHAVTFEQNVWLLVSYPLV